MLLDQSASGPVPSNDGLPSCSSIWHYILSLIHKFVVRSVIVIQKVEVSWVQEITIFRITEVNNPTSFRLIISVKYEHALITEGLLHSADSIEGNKALGEWLCLMVPVLAGIDIVWEVCGESIGEHGSSFGMAGNTLVTYVGAGCPQVGLYLEGTESNQQCCNKKHGSH